ncbi:MAG TPA: tubulin-like doman-containing protein [Longimicrobium sp.]|nr:tubulin-like doman-containing protein [Longimicrobium sp.]
MTFRVRKTVVIGLGGTGRDAVLNIKRKYMEVYGTDSPPTTKFLVFDTTDAEPLSLPDGREVRLQAGEFFKMLVSNPAGVVRVNQEVKAWFPDDGVPMSAIHAGAGQIRALGRLALFANGREVYDRVKNALDEINALKPHQDLGIFDLVDEQSVLINVVGSLSGGTGSGTFLDVGYLCRQHMDKARDKLVAYLLLPDVFVGKPATGNVQPNAYGALKELDYLMGARTGGSGSYMLGGYQIKTDQTPFEIVYLVNNRNRRGQVFQNVQELTELLGTGIFVSSGAAGKDAGDVWDNMRHQITSVGKFEGKSAYYSSFGVSELVLDTERFAEQEAHRLAVKTIENTFLGISSTAISEDVDDFITGNGLLEHDADQVIDALLPPGRYKVFRLPEKVGKPNIDEILERRDGHLASVEADAKQVVAENLKELTEEKVQAVRAHVRESLAQPNGLNYAIGFLNALAGRLDGFRHEMQQERDAFRERRKGAGGRYKAQREEAALAKQKWFGADKLLEEIGRNFAATLNDDAAASVEAMRRAEAAVLFTSVISEVKGLAEQLGDLHRRLESLSRSLNQDLERLRSQQQALRPFTIELALPENMVGTAPVAPDDFLVWLRDRKETVLDLAQLGTSEVAGRILAFARARDGIQQIRSMHIEDVLRRLPREQLAKRVKEMDQVAVPMWQYETAYVAGQQSTQTIYLFGVENADETIFTSDTQQMLSSNQPPQMASTADPRRVFCYKVEAAVPAFTVQGMEHYKLRYENPNAAFCYHAHRDWQRHAPDLWPNADDASRRVWSLGNADPFKLITRKGAFYYAVSKEQGRAIESFEVRLDQGRDKALRAFVGNLKLVNELGEEIERITRAKGAGSTADALRAYREKLLAEGSGRDVKPEIRQLLEEEIRDLDAYINEITSRI